MVYDLTHVRFEGVAPPGRRLREVVRSPLAPPPSPPGASETLSGEVSQFVRRVLEREGLESEAYRALPLQRRVPACLRLLEVLSEREALVVGKAELPPAGLALTAVARCVYLKQGA